MRPEGCQGISQQLAGHLGKILKKPLKRAKVSNPGRKASGNRFGEDSEVRTDSKHKLCSDDVLIALRGEGDWDLRSICICTVWDHMHSSTHAGNALLNTGHKRK